VIRRAPAGDPRRGAPFSTSSSPDPPAGSRRFWLEGNRLFWFLTIVAATAVAVWIVARLLILHGAGPVPTR
jgi:hypothetical protein